MSISQLIENEQEDSEVINKETMFLVHLKQHGLTYAVVMLLAQQMGLLDQVLSLAGGMC